MSVIGIDIGGTNIRIGHDDNGELKCQDQLLEMSDNSLLTTVFKDGELVREDTFADIRNRMYGGK